MSSRLRSMERNLIKKQVEAENAPERSKLRKEREDPTTSLPIERNAVLFKRKWNDHHYPSVEVIDKDGNTTSVSKRKSVKKKHHFLSGKHLVARMQYEKSMREQIAEKFRELKAKRKEEAEKKKQEKAEAKQAKAQKAVKENENG